MLEYRKIYDVKKELDLVLSDWKFDIDEGGILTNLSYRVHSFMEMVKDDDKYFPLQLIGVPKRIVIEIIEYLKPIINDPYWESVYGKENFLRLYRIPSPNTRFSSLRSLELKMRMEEFKKEEITEQKEIMSKLLEVKRENRQIPSHVTTRLVDRKDPFGTKSYHDRMMELSFKRRERRR